MKKITKKAKKAVVASKPKKAAPAPLKKPAAKPAQAAKPAASKAKTPDKKAPPPPVKVAAAPDKSKLKKAAPAPVAVKAPTLPPPKSKTDDAKKPMPKLIAKKDVPAEKVSTKVVTKKPAAETPAAPVGKSGAKSPPQGASKSAAASASKPASAPAPLKVEPKIIETQQPEYVKPGSQGDLFSSEELSMFKGLLEVERDKILVKARKAMEDGNIQIDKNDLMDEVDQASAMVEQNLTFRLLDRDRKLLAEIDHAIVKIDTGDFGYCEGTGEPIPKRRLELRPWCRHSVKYKEKLERMKKSGRGVVDEDEL